MASKILNFVFIYVSENKSQKVNGKKGKQKHKKSPLMLDMFV